MITTVQDAGELQAGLETTGTLRLGPYHYRLSAPLVVPPDRGFSIFGAGVGVTELTLDGPGDYVITGERRRGVRPLTIEGLTVSYTRRLTAGMYFHTPQLFAANRGHSAEVILEKFEVRPAPGFEWIAAPRYGVHLKNFTTPKVEKFWISGRFNDMFATSWDDGQGMQIGVYAENCQEAKVLNGYVHGARESVKVNCQSAGGGEGLEVSGNALINCLDGVVIDGEAPGLWGGYATPWSAVSRNHIFYLRYAMLGHLRSDLALHANSLCSSHFTPHPETGWIPVGIYLVKCDAARVSDNRWWNTGSRPPYGIGILADRCTKVAGAGNIMDGNVKTTSHAPGTTGFQVQMI